MKHPATAVVRRQPWMKWYPADWRADPRLRLCSLAARGLWADLIAYMHEGEPYGHLTIDGLQPDDHGIASLVGRPIAEVRRALAELADKQVFSKTDNGVIYSRRMVRDAARASRDRANGHEGGAPDVRRGTVPKAERSRPYRKSDAPEKTKRILARTGGACFWCDVKLVQQPKSEAEYPDTFHVDHLLPICDGGTNDEDNLVPACAVCNHDRSKVGWPENSRRKVDPTRTTRVDPTLTQKNSDTKAQKLEARDQKEREDDALRAPPSGNGRYAFEAGVIKLNERDLAKWTDAYKHLDLKAELLGLSEWASQQRSWFNAVQGALTKRNRDVRLAQERRDRPEKPPHLEGIL